MASEQVMGGGQAMGNSTGSGWGLSSHIWG
jgi:hypothetical protein